MTDLTAKLARALRSMYANSTCADWPADIYEAADSALTAYEAAKAQPVAEILAGMDELDDELVQRGEDDLANELAGYRPTVAAIIEREARLREALKQIGDYTHANSTGPAVHDTLWEVRAMTYDAIKVASHEAE